MYFFYQSSKLHNSYKLLFIIMIQKTNYNVLKRMFVDDILFNVYISYYNIFIFADIMKNSEMYENIMIVIIVI